MKNNKLVRFVGSFMLLPTLTMSGASMGPISYAVIGVVNTPRVASLEKDKAVDAALLEEKMKAEKAESIDAYFRARNMPLAGMGMKMVIEAEKNNLDWRLLPAISVRESTGGKYACKKVPNSAFGWGSCKISFKSHEEGIETVARNLGGNNPKTARYYAGKDVKEILRAYNPPSIVPRYAEQVMAIMDAIGDRDHGAELAVLN